jgi:hypothetical protein
VMCDPTLKFFAALKNFRMGHPGSCGVESDGLRLVLSHVSKSRRGAPGGARD